MCNPVICNVVPLKLWLLGVFWLVVDLIETLRVGGERIGSSIFQSSLTHRVMIPYLRVQGTDGCDGGRNDFFGKHPITAK